MNSITADKPGIDAANQDSYAGTVGHTNFKDEIYQEVIQIK
jgi:hypothetical protein